jgi:ubiquitin-protein ligase E3 C
VCHDLRDDFDSKISGLVDTTCLDESNSELTATLTRQLLYFYHAREETDGNRLSLLCQAYIKHKKMLEMPSDLMVYRLQRLTVTCCQAVATLSDVTMSAFTMQLRMLELLTNGKTFGQNHDVVARITAYAVENGWFSFLSHVLETSISEPVEASSSPPSPLAEILLSLLLRPLSLAPKCQLQHRLQIYRHLASDIFSHHSIPSIKLFLLPAINSSPLFKFDLLLESLISPSNNPNSDTEPQSQSLTVKPTDNLLHSILTCGTSQLTQMPGKVTINYATAVCTLLPVAVSVPPQDKDNASISSCTEDQDELLERLNNASHASQLLSIVCDGMSPSATKSLSYIAHWMMVEKRQSIHQSRLLSGLCYSRHFLQAIWRYVTSLSSPSVLGKSVSVIQQLCCGSLQLSESHLKTTAILLTVFSSLFCHSLFSLHDAEFHGDNEMNGSMPFSLQEIVDISAVLRDIAITLLSKDAADKVKQQSASYHLWSSLKQLYFKWFLRV